MPTLIPLAQLQNLQQIDAVVSGPDGANRLTIISGQFDVYLNAYGNNQNVPNTTTFQVLVGPKLTRQQFYKAIASSSVAKVGFNFQTSPSGSSFGINDVDADWDDESGQVSVKIEAYVTAGGGNNNTTSLINLAFQATILYAVAGA